MDWGAIIIAALTGGAVVKLLDLLIRRQELEADADKLGVTALQGVVDRLSNQLKEQDQRMDELEKSRLADTQKLLGEMRKSAELEHERDVLLKDIESFQFKLTDRDKKIANLERKVAQLLLRVEELELQLGTKGYPPHTEV
ncbi:MAG: ELKS/Rab6-interacting/CAST family protein [Chloroflexi bacterium]|nr:ELKS/Rab6-interacting/CAST family protein [Chloroflexota bacterium]